MIPATVMNTFLKKKSWSQPFICQVAIKEGSCWWKMMLGKSAVMATDDIGSLKEGASWFVNGGMGYQQYSSSFSAPLHLSIPVQLQRQIQTSYSHLKKVKSLFQDPFSKLAIVNQGRHSKTLQEHWAHTPRIAWHVAPQAWLPSQEGTLRMSAGETT